MFALEWHLNRRINVQKLNSFDKTLRLHSPCMVPKLMLSHDINKLTPFHQVSQSEKNSLQACSLNLEFKNCFEDLLRCSRLLQTLATIITASFDLYQTYFWQIFASEMLWKEFWMNMVSGIHLYNKLDLVSISWLPACSISYHTLITKTVVPSQNWYINQLVGYQFEPGHRYK